MIGTHGFALGFDTALSIKEMISKLSLRHPRWEWTDWQNDRWGDYVRGIRKTKEDPWFKILYDEDIQRWAVDVSFESTLAEADAISERLRAFVISELLPVVDAREVAALEDTY